LRRRSIREGSAAWPGERLVELALRRALEHPSDLGQQVGPAACELDQGGHSGGFLAAAQLALGYETAPSLPCAA
jgi:hypothetical protein